MSDALFSSDLEPSDTRYLWRMELADLLDLALSGWLGWGVLRAVDVDRTPGLLVLAGVAVWLVMSGVSGWSGWTLGRGLVGLRLMRGEGPPGPALGLARGVLAVLQLPLAPILQRRPLDQALKLRPEAVALLSPEGRRGLGWQAPWAVLALATLWFVVMPTPREALTFLHKLDGWRCCHSAKAPASFQCTSSVKRVVRSAEGGDVQAQALVEDCPRAQGTLGP